jgi:hypothetical protein
MLVTFILKNAGILETMKIWSEWNQENLEIEWNQECFKTWELVDLPHGKKEIGVKWGV